MCSSDLLETCGEGATLATDDWKYTHPMENEKGIRTLEMPNDPSSATRPTRRVDCNLDAMAGFAAAHG